MDLKYYWKLTPNQFQKHIDEFIKKEQDRAKEWDMNNFLLGKYILYAFNDPKHYPKKPFLDGYEEKEEQKVMTSTQMERIAKNNTIKLGGKLNGGN